MPYNDPTPSEFFGCILANYADYARADAEIKKPLDGILEKIGDVVR